MTTRMMSEWLGIHNRHYDKCRRNSELPFPLPDESLTVEFHDHLRDYFSKYPDQWTPFFIDLLK